ncbi:MAG: CPBP family intramembrane metalloprotease [Deltaproteobacteria bacterium]|nr:CPBP family intramembrane metalloprotease [Deltaproteobacteria bacterium]MBW2530341.1 CPBP family intramembrane metalloprotease [Deltaproteobacteria bacterium]
MREESAPAGRAEAPKGWKAKSNAWTDLGLTVPVFLGYHLGVVTLDVRNAADWVTAELTGLAQNNLMLYWGLTLVIGLTLVGVLALLGRGQVFEPWRFGLVAAEGALYAVLMGAAAAYVVGTLPLGGGDSVGFGAGVVMSLGAGLYEEIAFRVGLFGLPALLIRLWFGPLRRWLVTAIWAVIAAAVFSAWHYVGPLGDAFELRSFVFRWVCGVAFTAIYVVRGFAPAVWTHALYDIWVLALR